MKRHLVFILLSMLAVIGAGAQTPDWNKLNIDRAAVELRGERVVVTFDVSAARKTVKSKEAWVFMPVLTDGSSALSLPAVVVRGNCFKSLQKHHTWLSGLEQDNRTLWLKNGRAASYRVEIPYSPWMNGSNLVTNGLTITSRGQSEAPVRTLATALLTNSPYSSGYPAHQGPVVIHWERIGQQTPFTTGDLMAERYPFLMRDPGAGAEDPFTIHTAERETTRIIHFRTGSHRIEPKYRNNEDLLKELTSVIDRLQSAEDSRIERILIAGFASPEGELDNNEQLAYNRAMAVKEHLLRNTTLPYYRILLYNGSVDWQGLRNLVEHSDLFEKYEVISVIDEPRPDGDNRLSRLKQLNGGRTYSRLMRDFFPQLRSGTLIRIYYKNEAANR